MDCAFNALGFAVARICRFDSFFHMPALTVQDQRAMLTIHDRAIASPARPNSVLPGDRARGEFVSSRQGIGSLLVVIVKELTAGCHDAGRSIQVEDPPEPVE